MCLAQGDLPDSSPEMLFCSMRKYFKRLLYISIKLFLLPPAMLAAKRQDGGLFKSPPYPGYPFIMIPDLTSPYLPNGSLSPTARTVSSFISHCNVHIHWCFETNTKLYTDTRARAHTHPMSFRTHGLLSAQKCGRKAQSQVLQLVECTVVLRSRPPAALSLVGLQWTAASMLTLFIWHITLSLIKSLLISFKCTPNICSPVTYHCCDCAIAVPGVCRRTRVFSLTHLCLHGLIKHALFSYGKHA